MTRTKTITSWALSALVALAFVASGLLKLRGDAATETLLHETLHVPLWAIPLIGLVEVAGAVLIALPKTRFYGAIILVGTMAGAALTHLANLDAAGILVPAILGALAGTVAYLHRDRAPWKQATRRTPPTPDGTTPQPTR